jgi:hypothetical protein
MTAQAWPRPATRGPSAETYRRDMGGGRFVVLEAAAPIVAGGGTGAA